MKKSTIATQLEGLAKAQWHVELDITELLVQQHTGEPLPKVWVRTLTLTELNECYTCAHAELARLSKRAEGGAEAIKQREDLLDQLIACEVIYRAFRVAGNLAEHAFISPEWMRDANGAALDSDQISALWNVYNEARKLKNPKAFDVSPERVRALAEGFATGAGGERPEFVLAPIAREGVSQMFLVLSTIYVESEATREATRVSLAAALERIEELEAKLAA